MQFTAARRTPEQMHTADDDLEEPIAGVDDIRARAAFARQHGLRLPDHHLLIGSRSASSSFTAFSNAARISCNKFARTVGSRNNSSASVSEMRSVIRLMLVTNDVATCRSINS